MIFNQSPSSPITSTVVPLGSWVKAVWSSPAPVRTFSLPPLVVTIPVYLSEGKRDTKVEIQIRTIAMDFWASLEHKIAYKFEGKAPDYLERELKSCADMVDMLDMKMFSLNQAIMAVEEEERRREEEKRREREKAERKQEELAGNGPT